MIHISGGHKFSHDIDELQKKKIGMACRDITDNIPTAAQGVLFCTGTNGYHI